MPVVPGAWADGTRDDKVTGATNRFGSCWLWWFLGAEDRLGRARRDPGWLSGDWLEEEGLLDDLSNAVFDGCLLTGILIGVRVFRLCEEVDGSGDLGSRWTISVFFKAAGLSDSTTSSTLGRFDFLPEILLSTGVTSGPDSKCVAPVAPLPALLVSESVVQWLLTWTCWLSLNVFTTFELVPINILLTIANGSLGGDLATIFFNTS